MVSIHSPPEEELQLRGELFQFMLRRVKRVKSVADPAVQFALRFCFSHPGVSAAIPGIRDAGQARCNLSVLAHSPLPQDLLDQIAHLWKEDFRFNVRTSIGEEGEGERRIAPVKEKKLPVLTHTVGIIQEEPSL